MSGWRKLAILGVAFALAGVGAPAAETPWPFDQRQVLLVSTQGQAFPDDLATAQIMDQFVKRGRVRWVLQKTGGAGIVPVQVPADFPWHSVVAVRNLGLRYKVDGVVHLLRRGVQVDLRWFATIDGQPLFFETLGLPEAGASPADAEARKVRIEDWIGEIWERIPGRGYVVSRDLTSLMLEGGVQEGLKVGDHLELRRLQEIRRHPTLKTVVKIESSPSGMATVTTVGDPHSVAKVDFESKTDPIQPGDRYIVAPASRNSRGAQASADPPLDLMAEGPDSDGETGREGEGMGLFTSGRLLDLRAKVLSGTTTHSESVAGGSAAYEMSAFSQGFGLGANLYLTREWVVAGEATYGFMSFSNPPTDYAAGSTIGGNLTQFRLYGAYRFIFIEDPEEIGFFELGGGYGRLTLGIDSTGSAVAPTSKGYSGLDVGFAIRVPVMAGFGAYFRGFRSFSVDLLETPAPAGGFADSAVWDFDGGVSYRFNKTSLVSGGLTMLRANSSFEGLGTRAKRSLSTLATARLFHAAYTYAF